VNPFRNVLSPALSHQKREMGYGILGRFALAWWKCFLRVFEFRDHHMSTDRAFDDDSTLNHSKPDRANILEVHETGKRIVVGFGSQSVPDDHCLAVYREQIRQLIKQHGASEVVFDLKAFKTIQSGTLGLIASTHNEGVKVCALNVSPEIREVFELTNLDKIVEMADPRKNGEKAH
jgi:anti-anti-sigma factor